jgi:hypothetical protein
MPSYRLLSVFAVLACFGMPHAAAQKEGEVSVRFVSFPQTMEPTKVKLRLAEDKLLDIEAPTNWLSKPMRLAFSGTWIIGDASEGPDGKLVFTELGRTKAPVATDQIVLLVRKGKKNADGFELIALDAQKSAFAGGKYLFFNAAKVDVAGVVGGEKFVVKPNQHVIIEPKIPEGEHTVHAALYFRKGEEAKPFFSSEWRIGDDSRNMVFFYHDANTSHIRMHAIKDYIPNS